jgi:ADP-ribosylglycohydrolase
MRVAPLAFCLDPEQPEQRRTLCDVCRITHHNDEAYVGAVAVVVAVRAVAMGRWQPGDNLPALVAPSLPATGVRERLEAISRLDPDTSVVEVGRRFGCSGYVAESVPLAICAAQRVGQEGFAEALRQAIEAGGDTDTIGSLTGQIAGAWTGFERLPAELVRQLPGSDRIIQTGRAFAACLPLS